MNPFTKHTQQQGLTYLTHAGFALAIAWRLASTVFAFAVHGIFPFIDIAQRLDLESTTAFLQERNRWIESPTRKQAMQETSGLKLSSFH